MKNAKVQLGKVPPVGLACLLCLGLSTTTALAQSKDYAVQVAAVRSAQSAEEMKNGLRARGLDAYWVKSETTNRRTLYRVRLGKFTTVDKAVNYAERLLASGLLEAYAVTTFERPSDATPLDTLQAALEVQEFLQQAPSSDAGALLSAINARQWWLPTNRKLFTPMPSLSQREMLVFALGRHEWRLSNDLTVLLVRGPSRNASENALTPPARIVDFSTARPQVAASAQPGTLDLAASQTSVVSSIVSAQPVGQFGSTGIAPVNPSRPSLAESGTMVPTTMPEINGRGTTPTAARGISYAAPPRLQGRLEMMNGQLVIKLRNLDQDRSFTGVARATVNDQRHSTEVAPLQFNLPPDTEQVFPVSEAARDGDSWMLMVFDERGAMRLLRGAAFGNQTAAAQPAPTTPNPPGIETPPYVTGTYDATTPAPGQGGWMTPTPTAETPNPDGNPASSVSNTLDAASPTPPLPPPVVSDGSGQVIVTPKLIAATTENITIEFDISSPRPLNYISLTLMAGDYRDVRQALMSTPHGRVPFLIPTAQATGAFNYEIKDEAGRPVFSGAGDFRQLGRGQ